ncbi:hypothetical protein G8770_00215 [Aestuariicella hydrocarbonica]|uniref:Uncharacterized protein n=1 Tax=Pseudomaricurvus hydrocarbonicus TaxID=1470433 RepID=A0A9E5JSB9_9GAMM|nr:hypothetical protein [Aestuariicella hydrocarbonica]NHO63970.1 hypothetical protein [Aestuariicella hydrocarbonica]
MSAVDPPGSAAEKISPSDVPPEKRDKTDKPESDGKYSKRIFTNGALKDEQV